MADITIRIRNAIDQSIGRTLDVIENRAVGAAGSLERLENRMSSLARNQRRAVQGTHELIRQLRQLNSTVNANRNSLGGFNNTLASSAVSLGALGVGFDDLIRKVVELSDEVVSLENRISFFSDPNIAGNSQDLFDGIFESANRARVEVTAFSKTFFRIDRSFKEVGRSQADALAGTEAITKALQLSGATTSETSSALLQLSQAFNKGKLDGDEFRSVMENAPLFVEELAKSLNTTTGELLNLAPTGAITADKMAEALTNLADTVDEKFSKTTVTVSQAFSILENNVIKSMSNGNNATKILSSAILLLADNVEVLQAAFIALGTVILGVGIVGFVQGLRLLAGQVLIAATAIRTGLIASLNALKVAVLTNPIGQLAVGLIAVGSAIALIKFDSLDDFFDWSDAALRVMQSAIPSALDTMKQSFNGIFDSIIIELRDFGSLLKSAFSQLSSIIDGDVTGSFNSFGSLVRGTVNGILKSVLISGEVLSNIGILIKKVFTEAINFIIEGLNRVLGLANFVIRQANKLGTSFSELELPKLEFGDSNSDRLNDLESRLRDILSINFDPIKEFEISVEAEQAKSEIKSVEKELKNLRPEKIKLELDEARLAASNLSVKAFEDQFNRLKETGVDAQIALNGKILGTKAALEEGIISANRFNREMEKLNIEKLELEIELTGSEEAKLRLQELKDSISFRESSDNFFQQLRADGVGALTEIKGKMDAINRAREEGLIGQARFLQLQRELANEELGLKIELFGTEQQQAAFAFIEQFKVSMEEVRQIGIDAFSNISQGIGNATADLLLMQTQALLTGKSADGAFTSFKETLSDLGKNVLKQILSSFIQLGIQFLVNKALTKVFKLDIEDLNKKQSEAAQENRKNILANTALAIGSMVTTKAVGTAAGKALAQAYAPAAAAASLASFGANSIPAIAGIAATSAKANAAFGSGSFQEGGFTGNVATNRVAGVVHGQEFVVNAQNTARNRGLLEAMNRGFDAQSALRNSNLSPSVDLSRLRQVAPSNAPAANSGMMTNIDVVIENNIAGAQFDVQQDQDDRIRIIARQEAEDSIRNNVPDLVAGELANPNSSVSSSLSSNTTAERRRA